MGKKTKKEIIVCPCCKKEKQEKDLKYLLKWRIKYKLSNLGLSESYKVDEENKFRWACDTCIKLKKAIIARPDKQDYSYYPYFAYFDIIRGCKTCNEDYMYTKEQQLFWYEELGKNYWSRANNCLNCRIKKREKYSLNNKLLKLMKFSKHLEGDDEASIKWITEIIQIYVEMNNVEKAKFYMSKLRKIANKNNLNISGLEIVIKTMPKNE